jgi:PRTRC genetic system ThiF family protein
MTHTLTFEPRKRVRVCVVGAGGNGSKLLMGLKNLHLALCAFGGEGLHVVLADGDTVSEANLVRQAFFPSDLGQNKAIILVNRLNLSCGLDWQASPHAFSNTDLTSDVHLFISCVDTRDARRTIHHTLAREQNRTRYWLDLGNTRSTGQFVLGCPQNGFNRRSSVRLRTAAEIFPEIISTLPEETEPSCSTLQALERQDLFVHDVLVAASLNLVWRLLRYGHLSYHGGLCNVETGVVRPLPIEPSLWTKLSRRGKRVVARGRLPLFYNPNGTRTKRWS